MPEKKKTKSGRVSCRMILDLEDGELDMFMESEETRELPFIKPKIADAKKKRRPS